ncbi:hypothetical protein BGZ76_004746, partial [Entomortierella beljakovae]
TSNVLNNLQDKFFEKTTTSVIHPVSVKPKEEYNKGTCNRLDSPFEFESPPDFTKLGIESWTHCKSIVSLDGWKVEHCTAPGSTWPDNEDKLDNDIINNNSINININSSNSNSSVNSSSFLIRPKPIPEGQRYAYMNPPQTFSVPISPPQPCLDQNCSSVYRKSHLTQCNPSGYFRVQRLNVPATSYTGGSADANPSARCRNSNLPISMNESTRRYIEDFAGPDIIHVYINGAERYVTDQQINLGNCTYAIPYVLSRPGRFWVTRIVHAFHDYQALNENFDTIPGFTPRYLDADILPPVLHTSPVRNSLTELEKKAYDTALSNIHSFTVCEGCPQFLNLTSLTEYQDLPICSLLPKEGFREYGVHSGRKRISSIEDLETQTYGWVASRPGCRHIPELSTFLTVKNYINYSESGPKPDKIFGSPPPFLTLEEFSKQHNETKRCLSLPRHIYYAGDSHIQLLFFGLINVLSGVRSDQLPPDRYWGTHLKDIDGLEMRQDFDSWFFMTQNKLRYMLGKPPLHDNDAFDDWDLLKDYDSIVLDYGAWPMAGFNIGMLLTTEQYLAQMKPIIWDLAAVRFKRQEHYKKTGEGFSDLRIVWLGQVPWTDTWHNPDMRTNPRLKLWDILVDEEIQKVNDQYKDQGGMIDRVSYIPKAMVYRQLSLDQVHHTDHRVVDSVVQTLIHKFDLCQIEFKPNLNLEYI